MRSPCLSRCRTGLATVAACLPTTSLAWRQAQSSLAAFTPTFQATIPDVLPEEKDYTRAFSLSRLAYDLESLLSPALAAARLTVVSVILRKPSMSERRSIYDRTTRGICLYPATPRLRGLLSISLTVSAAGSMVIVNTVVFVQTHFGLAQEDTALALAAFGGGSMLAALVLPLLLIWFRLGIGYSGAQTPSGRLLRRSSHLEDRPALFAAQFALSHACWLITCPLAGWLGAAIGLGETALVLSFIAVTGLADSLYLWPSQPTWRPSTVMRACLARTRICRKPRLAVTIAPAMPS